MTESDDRRPVRSYVLRSGRMTLGQQRAFEQHWARWGLQHSSGALDYDAAFDRQYSPPAGTAMAVPRKAGPRVLEIGFGMGQSLIAMAQAAPGTDFIGIEVHKPGVGRLLHSMAAHQVDNIRVYCHDAVEVLRDCIAENSLDTIQIFFPDPWHKKRHNKRRLIQPLFVAVLTGKLKPGGTLHLATDWEHYAQQMMTVLSAEPGLSNLHGPDQYAPRPAHRPLTKFELRGERLGHGVRDLEFTRNPA